MLVANIHNKFKGLFDATLSWLEAKYWNSPRTNSVGGVEHPDDYERNVWMLDAFEQAANELGCRIERSRKTREPDDCYPIETWVAIHPHYGQIAAIEFTDCVCGGHGPRNARLLWPQGQGEIV